jgi:hypothetical protein
MHPLKQRGGNSSGSITLWFMFIHCHWVCLHCMQINRVGIGDLSKDDVVAAKEEGLR